MNNIALVIWMDSDWNSTYSKYKVVYKSGITKYFKDCKLSKSVKEYLKGKHTNRILRNYADGFTCWVME